MEGECVVSTVHMLTRVQVGVVGGCVHGDGVGNMCAAK